MTAKKVITFQNGDDWKGRQFFKEKNRRHRQLPPRVTPTLVTPLRETPRQKYTRCFIVGRTRVFHSDISPTPPLNFTAEGVKKFEIWRRFSTPRVFDRFFSGTAEATQLSNLVCRLTTRSSVDKCKITGQKDRGLSRVTCY